MITKVDINTASITRAKQIIIVIFFRQIPTGQNESYQHDLQRKYLEANSIFHKTFVGTTTPQHVCIHRLM